MSQFVAAAVADDSVEKTILQSRDTLFEEELFHELTRESRVLVSSGVTAHKDLIEFEYETGEQIRKQRRPFQEHRREGTGGAVADAAVRGRAKRRCCLR